MTTILMKSKGSTRKIWTSTTILLTTMPNPRADGVRLGTKAAICRPLQPSQRWPWLFDFGLLAIPPQSCKWHSFFFSWPTNRVGAQKGFQQGQQSCVLKTNTSTELRMTFRESEEPGLSKWRIFFSSCQSAATAVLFKKSSIFLFRGSHATHSVYLPDLGIALTKSTLVDSHPSTSRVGSSWMFTHLWPRCLSP